MDKDSLELELAKRKNKRLVTKNTKFALKVTRLEAAIDDIVKAVDEQAEDEGLWFMAETAPEAYLQQELRRLHAIIEERAKLVREKTE